MEQTQNIQIVNIIPETNNSLQFSGCNQPSFHNQNSKWGKVQQIQ